MPSEPRTRPSLTDTVADRILGLLHSGPFEIGDALPPLTEWTHTLGVPPQTVREALVKLSHLGVVDLRQGAGVYVSGRRDSLSLPGPLADRGPTKDLLLDVVEAREPIEVPAIELAAVHASPWDLDRLAACLLKAKGSPDEDAHSRANMEFHSAIAEASGNVVLCHLQRVLTALYQREPHVIHLLYGPRERDHAERAALLDAIRRRDPELAAARMRAHLAGVRQAVEQWAPRAPGVEAGSRSVRRCL